MTNPSVVQDKFLTTLEQTVNAVGLAIWGAFRLILLFPAMVSVLFTELLIWGDTQICKDPRPALLPVRMPRKEA